MTIGAAERISPLLDSCGNGLLGHPTIADAADVTAAAGHPERLKLDAFLPLHLENK
jgi:hypothetical protein